MIRNYLAAALHNLLRDKFYAAINIFGLAVGFAAAIIIGLYVNSELTFDRWIPGYQTVYRLFQIGHPPGAAPSVGNSDPDLAARIRVDVPSVETVARLAGGQAAMRRGDVEAIEQVLWADPEIFAILSLPTVAGNLKTALSRPDGIVLTRATARKYFGRDNAMGETIEINRSYRLVVTAILENFPSNTGLDAGIFISSQAVFSRLAQLDALPPNGPFAKPHIARIYLRLKPNAAIGQLRSQLDAFSKQQPRPIDLAVQPLSEVHTYSPLDNGRHPADALIMAYILSAVGFLILGVASINFVNLVTARAIRRFVEIGIRKAAGASRSNLIVQFLGEALLYAAFSLVVALALVEWLLPDVNAFLDQTFAFAFWRNPGALILSVAIAGATALLAGLYPALVLSAFSPAAALGTGRINADGRGMRRLLVTAQFAFLIALLAATIVMYRQGAYATNEALRLDTDQMLLIDQAPCDGAFRTRVEQLPGVRGVACSQSIYLSVFNNIDVAGRGQQVAEVTVDDGFFQLYGAKLLAGRFFDHAFPSDMAPSDRNDPRQPPLILNETAVAALGFASPQAAIGSRISFPRFVLLEGKFTPRRPAEIIGVVSDFSLDSIRTAIPPTVYFADPAIDTVLNVKLTGKQIPETLQAIDRIWRESGSPAPIQRIFLSQQIRKFYADVTRQMGIFTFFTCIALLIACLGLFSLASFMAERRTKEIGIRKAMGASSGNILELLIWEFSRPVLWANVVAWPVAYIAMSIWLRGFAYHIDLQPWMFIAASALALLIALATVSVHSLITARAKPVTALRYE